MSKDSCDLRCLDSATTVFIEEAKCGTHICLVNKGVLINSGRAPLAKIDGSTAIDVSFVKNFVGSLIDFFIVLGRVQPAISPKEFLLLDQTVPILVKLVERRFKLLLLGFCRQVTGHESKSCLFQLRLALFKKWGNQAFKSSSNPNYLHGKLACFKLTFAQASRCIACGLSVGAKGAEEPPRRINASQRSCPLVS